MALRIALDVNRYTDFCRGVDSVVDTVRRAEDVHLPFIVVGELRAGFRSGQRAAENEVHLRKFLHAPRVRVLYADEATTQFYAELFAELRAAGTPIPTNDLWIAALVLQHDLTLLSRDRHFDCIRRMPRLP